MRRPAGLNAAEYREWKKTIAGPHEKRLIVRVLDLDDEPVGRFEPEFLQGQRQWDVAADIQRTFTGDFLDPGSGVWFEPDRPSDGPLYRKRQLQIEVDVKVPTIDVAAGGRWVGSVEFTGPIVKYDRTGPMISVTCHGKDQSAAGTAGKVRNFPKKAAKAFVVRTVLADAGETKFSVPRSKKSRLTKKLTVGRNDVPVQVARHVAKSAGRILFWDGHGRCVYRLRSDRVVFVVGPSMLLSDITRSAGDLSAVKNQWVVYGRKPKGAQKRVRSKRYALASTHPLSAWALRRNGTPLPLLHEETNDQMTEAECNARARELKKKGSIVTDEVTFDCMPIYGLEEDDMVQARAADGTTVKVRCARTTLPFSTEGDPPMTIGAVRRATSGRKGRGNGAGPGRGGGAGGRGGRGNGGRSGGRRFATVAVSR